MIFCTEPPPAPLSRHVEYLWYHEGLVSDYPMEHLLPDGAIELIIDLTATPKRLFEVDAPAKFVALRHGWVSGQHRRNILIEAAKVSHMIGARFLPGGASAVFPFPIRDLNDRVVELDLLWSGGIGALRERLLAAVSAAERFQVLGEALLAVAAGRLEQSPALTCALRRIRSLPEAVTIGSLAADIGVSQKRLVGLFERHVGLKPKMLARVFRFQRVLQRLQREPTLAWSALAAEYGYYDQAHFIHDFSALSGMRPTEYLRDKGEYFNYVPVR